MFIALDWQEVSSCSITGESQGMLDNIKLSNYHVT